MRTSRSSSSTDHDPSPGAGAERLLEVGRIGRPHGVRGEVTVTLVTNRLERLAVGSELQTDRGTLRVVSCRPHQQRHLVAFSGIDGRAEADALRGLALRAAPIDDPAELWVHELIGARVIDQHGIGRGSVAHVVAGPAGDLLELADGTLVPLRFVVGPVEGDLIEVDVPDGLFETAP